MSDSILVVDDNAQNRKLARIVLEKNGFAVIEAINGAEALRQARERKPRLILMDIQMPDMDGVAALRNLLEDERTRDIPVIALTSYAMKGDRERFLADGFAAYLAKPVTAEDLLQAVKKILEQRYG